ncbi:hypothetical protein ACFL59_07380, partial [Planctomycetota bacterium]
LTRIFSVTLWYHFAFMAVSITMFGLATGGLLVYLLPRLFADTKKHLCLSSLLFAVSAIGCFLIYSRIPVTVEGWSGALSLSAAYIVLAVPFACSGVCISLALTRFPARVSTLYAADLIGAALGCLLLGPLLRLSDGPTVVFMVAAVAGAGSAAFGRESHSRGLFVAAALFAVLAGGFSAVHTVLARRQQSLIRLAYIKGAVEAAPLYEAWNSYSRVSIHGDPDHVRTPSGWGFPARYAPEHKVAELWMQIDAGAGTVLTSFDGDLEAVDYLRHDIVNLVHHLRKDAAVAVVGTGGGRDVLSALVFGQKEILAMEMNEDIADILERRFASFTGRLVEFPGVVCVNDEARSYLARQDKRFDVIQVSLVDTFAATSAGAFVLSENSLYTVEAWRSFLGRLSRNGVLTFSRWFYPREPSEMYRTTSLACAALREIGVSEPRKHVVVVGQVNALTPQEEPVGIATILVSPEPFSAADLSTIESVVAGRQMCEVLLSPRFAWNQVLEELVVGGDPDVLWDLCPLNLTAPTDDSPFFFNALRLRDVFRSDVSQLNPNLRAVKILGLLLAVVLGLTVAFILIPLTLTTGRRDVRSAPFLLLFFAGIGFGFMLIEVSQIQRLSVFLGHPSYGLSVALLTFLLSSGLGSYLTRGLQESAAVRRCFFGLLLVTVVFGLVTPDLIGACRSHTTAVRIGVAMAMLFPLGLFMGMAFPIGLKAAAVRAETLMPWLWGVNGAASVCASVLAVALAFEFGISTAYWAGFLAYVVAVLAYLRETRRGTE